MFKSAFTKLGLVEDTVPTPKTKATTPTKTAQPAYVPAPSVTLEVDAETAKALEQSLQENKLSGFDYLKFIAATEEMKAYGTPEETRFKMAFSTAKQLGLDINSLVKSGQHYLDVLEQNENEFKSDCAQFEKEEVQSKEIKISQLEVKLTTLSEQLTKAKQERDSLTGEVQEKKAILESRRTSFQNTLKTFTSNIEANIAKINQFLS